MIRAVLALGLVVGLLCLTAPSGTALATTPHYLPRPGDGFAYAETIQLNGGTGNYTGYTETSHTVGSESVTSISPNGIANATWSYTTDWANNTGSSQHWTSAGTFSFSAATFHYVRGTDNQTGQNGSEVWFWMNNSLAAGSSIYPLSTQLTVQSDNSSYHIEGTPGRWVATIYADGNGSYQRHDVYGKFTAAYQYQSHYDPATGYIVGFVYIEQDRDSAGNGFTYTDAFNSTSTTYPLTAATPPSPSPPAIVPVGLFVGVVVLVLILIVVIVVVIARSRGQRRLPTHSSAGTVPYAPPPMAAPPIHLTPTDQPIVQQIVMRDTVKVNCRFCGALIDTTADRCPNCGAPRT